MTDIKNSIRTVPDFPIKGIQFRDITGLVEDPESFNKSLIPLAAAFFLSLYPFLDSILYSICYRMFKSN